MSDINVTITFSSETDYTVDKSFISVPANTHPTIKWTIDRAAVNSAILIEFDDPAITLFGGAAEITRTDALTAELVWQNYDPALWGKSFYYRLHMFGTRPSNSDRPGPYAIDHDPTIHNDPPS